ncbi:MAG: hypothetical protein C0615_06535 [Desulfuromonas sp.]|nr:MAG: hypothetical protein C0615_06535 [Desulfuromonas sp.]
MRFISWLFLLFGVCLQLFLPCVSIAETAWEILAPGMQVARFEVNSPVPVSDTDITVLRVDPQKWGLDIATPMLASDSGGMTAREWSWNRKLAAVINAGMFGQDHRTHLGFMQVRDQVLSGHVNSYKSVAAFDPRREGLPPFCMFDLDVPGVSVDSILQDYSSVVQNLRLIKKPGQNRWSQQEKAWSEVALGEDSMGRILFIFCRAPMSMHDFNNKLLSLDLNLVAAQHLEGGPEAQMFVNIDGQTYEKFGSYETGFTEHDHNGAAWPVPNVLGVKKLE